MFKERVTLHITAVFMTIIFVFCAAVNCSYGAEYSIEAENVNIPEYHFTGDSSEFKGRVKSTYDISYIKAGICNSKGDWIKGHYTSRKPEKKTYGISQLNEYFYAETLKKGTYYFKIYVRDSEGHKKTVLKEKFKVCSPSLFESVDVEVPLQFYEGEDPSIKGKIKSRYNIEYIKAGIKSDDGKWIKGYYISDNPKKTSYELKDGENNYNIKGLEKGNYYYAVYVRDSRGTKKTVIKEAFTVKTAPSFTLKNHTYPETVKQGDSFHLKGKLTSAYTLKTVKVGICDSDGTWMKDFYSEKQPDKKTFDISSADKDIAFGDLMPGDYYYVIYAEDSEGYKSHVLERRFTVLLTPSKLTLSDNTSYPCAMITGSSFTLVGNVYSAVNLDYVRAGVCDLENSWIKGFNQKKSNIGKKTFYISSIDSMISFGALEPGRYIYRIYAKDVNGKGKTLLKTEFEVIEPFEVDRRTEITEDEYTAINGENVYLKQEPYREGCTVTSAGMMARRKAILSGVDEKVWSLITEWNLRADRGVWAYGQGLLRNFSILGIDIKQVYFDSNKTAADKKKALADLLKKHPEGISIYGKYNGKAHAVLLTDYIDGDFYVVDPVYGYKTKMSESTLYSKSKTQTSKLYSLKSYWYVVN